jgi:hypothetical protein
VGLSAATLNGHRVTSARANIPAWGCWFADASVDGEVTIAGAVELKIADLTLRGTVLSGGPAKGRSHFRIVAGAGGWGRSIKKEGYANDAGVKLSTVLGDAAALVGETLDASTMTAADRVGPSYTREAGPACHLLELEAKGAWYVREDGVTCIGRRASSTLKVNATHGPVDLARGTVTLAAESIASILPGLVVDGLTVVDVLHEISAEGGLRSTVWGGRGAGDSRQLAAMRAIFDQLDPERKFRGVTEYRVVTLDGERLNLQAIRVSTGMPDLRRVLVRPGVAGCKATLLPGTRVLVGFVDSDPGRPYVAQVEDAEGAGFLPVLLEIDAATFVRLGAGALPVIVAGNLAGIFPCIPTQLKVLA